MPPTKGVKRARNKAKTKNGTSNMDISLPEADRADFLARHRAQVQIGSSSLLQRPIQPTSQANAPIATERDPHYRNAILASLVYRTPLPVIHPARHAVTPTPPPLAPNRHLQTLPQVTAPIPNAKARPRLSTGTSRAWRCESQDIPPQTSKRFQTSD